MASSPTHVWLRMMLGLIDSVNVACEPQVRVMEEVDEEPEKPDQLINFALIGHHAYLKRQDKGSRRLSSSASPVAARGLLQLGSG